MWIEFNGEPIKWNYPIGAWFDAFCFDSPLPWTVTVHFEDYPETKILHCPSKDAVKSQFMSSIKEADSLKHKGQVINTMQERDHHQLWLGFLNDKFDQFWSVNKKLMESNAGEGFRHIPIKCYMHEKPMQKLVKPIDDTTGNWTTLQEALLEFDPKLDFNKIRVITHGIEPSLKTPLQWMSEHLSYPDNFLHIAIIHSNTTRHESNQD
jgi:autophagy-related protein 5